MNNPFSSGIKQVNAAFTGLAAHKQKLQKGLDTVAGEIEVNTNKQLKLEQEAEQLAAARKLAVKGIQQVDLLIPDELK